MKNIPYLDISFFQDHEIVPTIEEKKINNCYLPKNTNQPFVKLIGNEKCSEEGEALNLYLPEVCSFAMENNYNIIIIL